MNLMALFDKSFLHSLSRREATLYDVLFFTNITPIFFAETLADLEKEIRDGRTPEAVVGNLAYKTPRLHSYTNVPHWMAAAMEFAGYPAEMRCRPLMGGAREVEVEGKQGIVHDIPPEMEAMTRWQEGEFLEVERLFAKHWRSRLAAAPHELEGFLRASANRPKLASFEDVKKVADALVRGDGQRYMVLKAAMAYLDVPVDLRPLIVRRWKALGGQPLALFAPYVAYVLSVEVFYLTAVASGLIGAQRASNHIDISYLFYLPFTEVFISGDDLHRRTAPLFLKKNQRFVWAPDLKADLARLADHYGADSRLATEGLMRVARDPPLTGDYLLTRLHDELRPGWRDRAAQSILPRQKIPTALKKEMDAFVAAAKTPQPLRRVGKPVSDPERILIKRSIPLTWGGWQFLPPDIKGDDQS